MKATKTYNKIHQLSALFMVFALLWLTVSLPFVMDSQDQLASHGVDHGAPLAGNEEEASTGLGNSTEEKAPTTTSASEEYLHEHQTHHHLFFYLSQLHGCEDDDTYHAYHGEVQVPPPNA